MTTTTLTTLLTLPPDLVARDRVRRQALRVGALRHDGLAPLREAAFAGEGLALTWEIPAESARLEMGDAAIAAIAPIAAGLALLHDAGLAHGGITGDCVHVHSGRGILSGWRPGGTPEGDVADLIALMDTCLPSASVGAEVATMLIAGSDPDPAARPTMARLAAALERAAAASAALISPPAHRRARPSEAPPPRPAEPRAPREAAHRSEPVVGRGRHAVRRAPAGTRSLPRVGIRMTWRWGIALGGAALAGFLGLSALGSSGSAQEICPAPTDRTAWMSLVERGLPG
ncbi:MAG: hypothetical protein FJW85_01610 [Actinobacteria bacterium]|nr:hypothetical protein [Actinomycetota bacterium]